MARRLLTVTLLAVLFVLSTLVERSEERGGSPSRGRGKSPHQRHKGDGSPTRGRTTMSTTTPRPRRYPSTTTIKWTALRMLLDEEGYKEHMRKQAGKRKATERLEYLQKHWQPPEKRPADRMGRKRPKHPKDKRGKHSKHGKHQYSPQHNLRAGQHRS